MTDARPHDEQFEPGRPGQLERAGQGQSLFSVDLEHDSPGIVASLRGELDLSTAPHLLEVLTAALGREETAGLVIDLSELEYMDSTGLSVLVSVHKRATEREIAMTLRYPRPAVDRLLRITSLDAVLTIERDRRAHASEEPPADRTLG